MLPLATVALAQVNVTRQHVDILSPVLESMVVVIIIVTGTLIERSVVVFPAKVST
jgi:hypothetical protein